MIKTVLALVLLVSFQAQAASEPADAEDLNSELLDINRSSNCKSICSLCVANNANINGNLGVGVSEFVYGNLTVGGSLSTVGPLTSSGPVTLGACVLTCSAGTLTVNGAAAGGFALGYAYFYLAQPDPSTIPSIAPGDAVPFANAAVAPTGGISSNVGGTTFTLATPGTYRVIYQVSALEAAPGGQLVVNLNGSTLAQTRVGRATGKTQIIGSVIVTTTLPNSTLQILNPPGDPNDLTPDNSADQEGTAPLTGSLVIIRIA
jgi:hypothetical protein